jgi:hypothetical protein
MLEEGVVDKQAKSELATIAEDEQASEATPPIVVKLGKVKRKRIKQLMRGQGPLMDDVGAALEQVKSGLGEAIRGRQLIPIVFVYREKRKRRKGLGLPFGL